MTERETLFFHSIGFYYKRDIDIKNNHSTFESIRCLSTLFLLILTKMSVRKWILPYCSVEHYLIQKLLRIFAQSRLSSFG